MAEALNLDAVVLDESTGPPLRWLIGALLAAAVRADVAIEHVRLGAVDLTAPELQSVFCRLLLGRLDVGALAELERAGAPEQRLAAIAAFLDSGRLDVRAAGVLRWRPDFAVFELPPPQAPVALIGALYFHDAAVGGGPALTCVIRSPAAIARLRRRFEELWERGRDVSDVLRAELPPAAG
jgi:hypothetical protein